MNIKPLHRWDLEPSAARDLQSQLAEQVDVTTPLGPFETIAGADASYDRGGDTIFAGVVVVRVGTWEVVERAGAAGPSVFPYVPGLLSFREAPTLLEAFAKLKTRPDVVMCDGQGIAHPRRLGIASHVGLWLNLPTIGCAKSLLCGRYEEPGPAKEDRSPLMDREEVIGAVVRTRRRIKPVYVSPGHLCDLEGAVEVVLATCPKYRLPVPSRLAHDYVNAIRRAVNQGQPLPDGADWQAG